jgi:hypothetical protein
VDEEEKAGGEKHGAEDGDEPEGRVLAGLDDVEGGETDEDACDHEGEAEKSGGAAVDGGCALGGVVGESGGKAGAAAEHALLDVGRGFGGGSGDGESHGWRPWPECRRHVRGAIGLCERDTLYLLAGPPFLCQGKLKRTVTFCRLVA